MSGGGVEGFRYVVSGLSVLSDVELRSAMPADFPLPAEVTIKRAELPPLPPEGVPQPDRRKSFRIRVTDVGRFLIEDGRSIRYEPFPGYDEGALALHLIGTCFAAVLQQRGSLVLHASAVSVRGGAMLFCGASGAGKSTLAAMLCERGYPLLNDDVCHLVREADGRYAVAPDGRMLKLWTASLQELQQAPEGAPIRMDMDKYYATPGAKDHAMRPVRAIYLLGTLPLGTAPMLEEVGTASAMTALHDNAFRPELVQQMGQQAEYFAACAVLCRQARVYRLARPMDFRVAGAAMDLLEGSWETARD